MCEYNGFVDLRSLRCDYCNREIKYSRGPPGWLTGIGNIEIHAVYHKNKQYCDDECKKAAIRQSARCVRCGKKTQSRNQLFHHLRDENHFV
jgi:hypothetical protein